MTIHRMKVEIIAGHSNGQWMEIQVTTLADDGSTHTAREHLTDMDDLTSRYDLIFETLKHRLRQCLEAHEAKRKPHTR